MIAQVSTRNFDDRLFVGPFIFAVFAGLLFIIACLADSLVDNLKDHDRLIHLARVTSRDFSEKALSQVIEGTPGSLVIAREHDPLRAGSLRDVHNQKIKVFSEQFQAFMIASRTQSTADTPAFYAKTSQSHMAPPSLRASLEVPIGSDLDQGQGSRSDPFRQKSGRIMPMQAFILKTSNDQTRDLECLTQAVYYEDRGDTISGMEAVAQVVLNRVRHRAFPKSICGVVFQGGNNVGCQFSFACDGSIGRIIDAKAWHRARDIATRALQGKVIAAVGNATYFHAATITPNWAHYLIKIGQVGAHVFYRYAGHNAASSMFDGEVVPSEPASIQEAVANPVSGAFNVASNAPSPQLESLNVASLPAPKDAAIPSASKDNQAAHTSNALENHSPVTTSGL